MRSVPYSTQTCRDTVLLLFSLLAVIAFTPHGSAQQERKRPNIVLIMADDLGFSDLGCYGSEIRTPTLDGLANDGLRFSRFYNTAKCHSSRICLLTGLYCGQAGNQSMRHGHTIAEVLKNAGYFTAMSGKWHLDGEPTERGFERYFGHLSGATNFFTGDKTFRLNGQPWSDFDKDFYTTDRKTDFALGFIDEARDSGKPFFLYLAYNAPHYPLQAPEEEVKKYIGKYSGGWDQLRLQRHARLKEMGMVDKSWPLSPRPDHVRPWESLTQQEREWEDRRMATFAAMVDRLDQNIGRIVTKLKEQGTFENTLIMFCSDNGACPFERTRGKKKDPWDPESYWTYDTGWAHAGNTPFRWYKQNQHEGGISSPLVVHWPMGLKTEPGSITHQPGHLIDFMATCMDIAKATLPQSSPAVADQKPVQGKSLLPVFHGSNREPHDLLYFHFSNNRAIVTADHWKLVSARGGPWELYHLTSDRTELRNLTSKHPDRVKQLRDQWHQIASNTDNLQQRQRKPVRDRSQPWKAGEPKD